MTFSDQPAGARRRRRLHSDEFKANAVAACMQPGISMAAVAWVLNFTVTNNLGGTNAIYFFGVSDPAASILSLPANWTNWGNWSSGDLTSYGGPAIDFNDSWFDDSNTAIEPGASLSGFEAIDTSVNMPGALSWFAFAHDGDYTGDGHYNDDSNPGFAGIASIGDGGGSDVPEPETFGLVGAALAGLGLIRRRRGV